MIKVEIGGREYEYRFDMGALLRYEQLTGALQEKMASATALSAVMHYCCLAGDESFAMSLAAFVAAIDSKVVLDELNNAYLKEKERWEGLNADPGEEKNAKKLKKK